jgi:hypothetical protein
MILSWAHRFGVLFAHGRARAVVLLVGVAGVLALAPGAAGAARASGSETINTTIPFPTFPTKAPERATYTGTFSASGTVADSGTVTVQAMFVAVPNTAATGVLQQVRTYIGSQGTLTLRCNQRLFPPNKPQPGVASNTGSCVVHDATGAYAGLKGSGSLTGITDFTAPVVTVQDTLVL